MKTSHPIHLVQMRPSVEYIVVPSHRDGHIYHSEVSIIWHTQFPNVNRPVVTVPVSPSILTTTELANRVQGELANDGQSMLQLTSPLPVFLYTNPIFGCWVNAMDAGSTVNVCVEINEDIDKWAAEFAGTFS